MNIIEGKFCTYCKAIHPYGIAHWYPRKNHLECKIKRAEIEANYRDNYKSRKLELQKLRTVTNSQKYKATYKAAYKSIKGKFRTLKSGAKRRGYGVDINFEEYSLLVENKKCHYCNGELSPCGHNLDRIDSTISYTIENCVPCCKACNLAKHVMSYDEFKTWITKVFSHLIQAGNG